MSAPEPDADGYWAPRTSGAGPLPPEIINPITSLESVPSIALETLRKPLETMAAAVRSALASCALPVQSPGSGASEATPAPTNEPPGVHRAPSPYASNKPPRYPIEARRRRQSGTVLLHVVINTDGTVSRVSIARSSGYALLDAAASDAAAAWRFTPATRDGEPQPCEADLPVEFVLE